MKHIIFALFRQTASADSAMEEVKAAGIGRRACNFIVHRDKLNIQDLVSSESDGRQGLVGGLVNGSMAGALLGD